jgi:hypothetical protein
MNLPKYAISLLAALVSGRYRTVRQLFEGIAENKNADRLEVEYRPNYGYPSRIVLNYLNIADAQLTIITKGLQRLRGQSTIFAQRPIMYPTTTLRQFMKNNSRCSIFFLPLEN